MGELEQEEQQKCQLLTSPEKTQRHMPLQWWVNIILFLHKETFWVNYQIETGFL